MVWQAKNRAIFVPILLLISLSCKPTSPATGNYGALLAAYDTEEDIKNECVSRVERIFAETQSESDAKGMTRVSKNELLTGCLNLAVGTAFPVLAGDPTVGNQGSDSQLALSGGNQGSGSLFANLIKELEKAGNGFEKVLPGFGVGASADLAIGKVGIEAIVFPRRGRNVAKLGTNQKPPENAIVFFAYPGWTSALKLSASTSLIFAGGCQSSSFYEGGFVTWSPVYLGELAKMTGNIGQSLSIGLDFPKFVEGAKLDIARGRVSLEGITGELPSLVRELSQIKNQGLLRETGLENVDWEAAMGFLDLLAGLLGEEASERSRREMAAEFGDRAQLGLGSFVATGNQGESSPLDFSTLQQKFAQKLTYRSPAKSTANSLVTYLLSRKHERALIYPNVTMVIANLNTKLSGCDAFSFDLSVASTPTIFPINLTASWYVKIGEIGFSAIGAFFSKETFLSMLRLRMNSASLAGNFSEFDDVDDAISFAAGLAKFPAMVRDQMEKYNRAVTGPK